MSEEVYAKLDLSKKVRFQKRENEDKTIDVCDDADNSSNKDNSVIYDNCYVEESSPPKPEDGTTEDQHKIVSVSVNPHKRNLVGAAAVLLVLFLLLLAAVIVILIQNSRLRDEMETLNFNLNIEKHHLQTNYNELQTRFTNMSREKDEIQTNYNESQIRFTNMSREKDQLQTNYNELQTRFTNMSRYKDQLQANYNESQIRFTNMSREKDQLQTNYNESQIRLTNMSREKDQLQANYNELQTRFTNMSRDKDQLQTNYSQVQTLYTNLTQMTQQLQVERDSLKQQLETSCCPDKWKRFSNSCLWFSNFTKNWNDSNQTCGALGAQLVMIKTPEKQVFISSKLTESSWIGLTNVTVWKWIDGTTLNLTQTFWKIGQPDNWGGVEHCGQIAKDVPQNNWNDLNCNSPLHFICEKIIIIQ